MQKLFSVRGTLLLVCLLLTLPSLFAQNKPYKGAEIYTDADYLYGKMEMRMRMAKGDGLLSTFFTYKTGSEQANTFWEEIDIEVFGKNNATEWQSNILSGQGSFPTDNSQEVHEFCQSLGDGYHTYGLEWAPNYIAWFIDGVEITRKTGGQANDINDNASLRFNIWAAFEDQFPEVGPFDANAVPRYQFVNWIKFYNWNGSGFNSTPSWTDNFNGSDVGSRWNKANWTFGANRADFSPQNVVVKNGYLVLAFTRAGEEGYTGTPPADTGTPACPGGGGGVNSVTNLSAPNSFPVGGSITGTFNYNSTANNRDLLVTLQQDSPPWTVYAQRRIPVNAGSGSRSITLDVPGSAPVVNDNYQFQVLLTTRNGGWGERLAEQTQINIDGTGGTAIATGTYNIKNPFNGQNMGAFSWNSHNARMINAGGWSDQKWDVIHLGGDVYHVQNVGTGRFLEVPYGNCGNANNVATWTNGTADHQQWFIQRVGGNFTMQPNHCRSQGADRAGGANNANVITYAFDANNPNQQWNFVPTTKSGPNGDLTPPSKLDEVDFSATLVPNPTSARNAGLEVTLGQEIDLEVSLFDVSGRRLVGKTIVLGRGQHRVSLEGDLDTELPAGVYLVRVQRHDEVITKRLVVR